MKKILTVVKIIIAIMITATLAMCLEYGIIAYYRWEIFNIINFLSNLDGGLRVMALFGYVASCLVMRVIWIIDYRS